VSSPTPQPETLPANALDDARTLLHGVLADVFELIGWGRDRADRYPPPTIRTPCGWVDAATLSPAGNGLAATFPIMIAVDGTDRGQVTRLDALLAVTWERLYALKIPQDAERLARGSTLTLLTAGPDDVDLGGVNTRALSFAVQVPIAPRTLCPTALTERNPTP
jgi:hypothetical protein